MGSPLPEATWNGVEGAFYMGLNSIWEPIWLFASIACCVLALLVGGRHENEAYRRRQQQ